MPPPSLPSVDTSPDQQKSLWILSLFVCVIFSLGSQILLCSISFGRALTGLADFRALYAAGYIVRTGNAVRLYDYNFEHAIQSVVVGPRTFALPFVYPPYSSLLFVPLSLVSYRTAFVLFFITNLLLAALVAAVMRPHMVSVARFWRPLPYALFLCFFPLAIALLQGQVSILLLLLYCTCYTALHASKPFLAGLILSIALIKPQIAFPVIFLFLAWRQWRFVQGFVTGAALLGFLSFWVVRLSGSALYLRSLFSMAGAVSVGSDNEKYGMFPAAMPNLHGLFYKLSHGASWGTQLTIVLSLLILVWAARQRPSLPLALLAGMLVSYHLQLHDLFLLLLPLSVGLEAILAESANAHGHSSTRGLLYKTGWSASAVGWRKVFIGTAASIALLLLTPPVALFLIARGLGSALCFTVAVAMFWTASPSTFFKMSGALATRSGVISTRSQ